MTQRSRPDDGRESERAMTEIDINFVRDHMGGVRTDYTEAELQSIPEERRERFVELISAAKDASDAEQGLQDANAERREMEGRRDRLIKAKNLEYPPMTQHEAYLAYLAAHAPK